MPKISILVPIYNASKYLRQAIDSLVNQTLQDIEIICINDGSTDNSLKIIEEYASKDARIVILDKPNTGYGDSMNQESNLLAVNTSLSLSQTIILSLTLLKNFTNSLTGITLTLLNLITFS